MKLKSMHIQMEKIDQTKFKLRSPQLKEDSFHASREKRTGHIETENIGNHIGFKLLSSSIR